MKQTGLILAALATLLLAACGGNGGTYQGALPDHTAKPTVPDTAVNQGGTGSQPSQPDTRPTAPPAVQNQGIAGYYMQVLPGRNSGQISVTDEGNQDLGYLKVNGEKIELLANADSAGNIQDHYITGYSDVFRYGVVRKNPLEADKRTDYLFVHGKMTPADQLPTQDKVVFYEGMSIFSNANGIVRGRSEFDVNFGKKTLSGKVTADGTDIPLAATIEDGRFHNPSSEGTYVKGAFFGHRGKNLGGVFKRGDTVGSFGAINFEK